jgi:glycosyltransferase involved in cell wall biosynthesis
MHQLAFVEALDEMCDLTWIIEEENLDPSRTKMGWLASSSVGYKTIKNLKSSKKIISELEDDVIHVFGGFSTTRALNNTLKYLIKNKARVFVQTESYNFTTLKGIFGILKFYFKRIFLRQFNVEGVFAMGKIGVVFFSKVFLNFKNVYPFAYFTGENKFSDSDQNNTFKIIFVGQLIRRKGIDLLLKSLSQIDRNYKLDIIGNGVLQNELENFVKSNNLSDSVKFLGSVNNEEVKSHIANSDLLILPSRFDGWGAVVNEALMSGTPVITSKRCGSSVLVANNRGLVVKSNSVKSLRNAISEQIEKGCVTNELRNDIISWSKCLSGKSAAEYFIECIVNKKTIAPWLS